MGEPEASDETAPVDRDSAGVYYISIEDFERRRPPSDAASTAKSRPEPAPRQLGEKAPA